MRLTARVGWSHHGILTLTLCGNMYIYLEEGNRKRPLVIVAYHIKKFSQDSRGGVMRN